MVRNFLLFLLTITALLPFEIKAEWVSLDKNKTKNTPPKVTILQDDEQSTVLKIELSGFDVTQLVTDGKTYQVIDLLSDVASSNAGFPDLPYIAKVLAIPDQAGVSVEVLETGDAQVFKNILVPPSRASWWEGKPMTPYLENADVYGSNDIFPSEIATMEDPVVFRDFRIARLTVYPARFIPASNELQVFSSVTVKINYGKGPVVNPKTTGKRAVAPSFGQLYRSTIFNYESVLNRDYGGREDGRELMLCIMPDEFETSFQVYADWKRQSGVDIHVTKFSDIGANASNPDIPKNHIADAFHNWENPPTYVLIIGDDGVFPKKIVTYPDYSFPSDNYFVEIDGNDYFPELLIGRWTNQGDYRMQVMINKFLLYEKNPYVQETGWFKKAVLCSNNEYQSQVDTKLFVGDVLTYDGGFTQVDKMMSDGNGWGGGCTYDLTDIKNAINEGRSFLNYRGEGWYYGWYASCYDFPTDDVSSLQNGQKFTFVTSIGCGVAMFDCQGGNSFGEEWVEMGTITSPKGAPAFIGPTSNTHTTYNNRIDKGIYVGMFQEGMDTPGQALLRGKLYMYNVFGNDYYTQYHYKIFHTLGDPSIHIWKTVPWAVNASYPTTIPVGEDLVEFTVNFASSGLPVANAIVCVTGEELFYTGVTDATGKVTIDLITEIEETLTVTVRGGNVIPHQGTIQTELLLELIEPEGQPLIVDIDGNTDGLINPNEHCNATFTLKNWGAQTANNIQAVLSTPNTNYVDIITTSPVSFGNIASGGSSTGSPFQFFVKPSCPIGQIITLNLHITSNINSWDYSFTAEVMGCHLLINNYAIHDASSPNMNFRMDPGETVVVILSIENDGDDLAPDVTGVLSCNDPYITIIDGIGGFGTIEMNENSINMENNFVVQVSPTCPVGHVATYTLTLETQNGYYPYETMPTFQIPVGVLIPSDYTGPDYYGYYMYSSDDTFYDQTPEFDWIELVGTGTALNLPNNSDYTETVNLPFLFQYYGNVFNQVRISTDGWIAFGSGNQTLPVNTQLPNNDIVNNMVAVFWDDLFDDEFYMGDIYHYYDVQNNRFIIEWDSIAHNNFLWEPEREVFQVILLDPDYYNTASGDGEIILQYKKVENVESITVGIEDQSQYVGLQYLYNMNFHQTASALFDGNAIKITTEPPFSSIMTSIDENQPANPNSGYSLAQNIPNPFSTQTRINYVLPDRSNVSLHVYDVRGQLVRVLYEGEQQKGAHSVIWSGLNDEGNPAASGIYLYQLKADSFVQTNKMFLFR